MFVATRIGRPRGPHSIARRQRLISKVVVAAGARCDVTALTGAERGLGAVATRPPAATAAATPPPASLAALRVAGRAAFSVGPRLADRFVTAVVLVIAGIATARRLVERVVQPFALGRPALAADLFCGESFGSGAALLAAATAASATTTPPAAAATALAWFVIAVSFRPGAVGPRRFGGLRWFRPSLVTTIVERGPLGGAFRSGRRSPATESEIVIVAITATRFSLRGTIGPGGAGLAAGRRWLMARGRRSRRRPRCRRFEAERRCEITPVGLCGRPGLRLRLLLAGRRWSRSFRRWRRRGGGLGRGPRAQRIGQGCPRIFVFGVRHHVPQKNGFRKVCRDAVPDGCGCGTDASPQGPRRPATSCQADGPAVAETRRILQILPPWQRYRSSRWLRPAGPCGYREIDRIMLPLSATSKSGR
jgi:hypothetical protein